MAPTSKDDPIYPFVRCEGHENRPERPGYVVCFHVADGAPIKHFEQATATDCGVISCGVCTQPNQFTCGCAYCCAEAGWLPS